MTKEARKEIEDFVRYTLSFAEGESMSLKDKEDQEREARAGEALYNMAQDYIRDAQDNEASGTFVTVTMSREQWEEVREALASKTLSIRNGELGPEIEAGEDERWLEDLAHIADTLDEALQ